MPTPEAPPLGFLKNRKSNMINLQSNLGGEEDAMKAFKVPGGAIPYYRVYDITGQLIKSFGANLENPSTSKTSKLPSKRCLASSAFVSVPFACAIL